MIQRINLIESQPLQLTYEQLVKGLFVILAICGVFYIYQSLMGQYYASQEAKLTVEVNSLKTQREQMMTETTPQVSQGPVMELKTLLDGTPSWSKFLNDLLLRIPTNVWFTSLKTSSGAGRTVVIQGVARDAKDLADFLDRLGESPFISNPVLSSAKKQTVGFDFAIECVINNIKQ